MPRIWGFAALLTCWILHVPCAGADPSLEFPVNAQVPPVARISEAYIFVFSASTFTSADGPISYTLWGQPNWLQLISGTRTFSGTPGPQDVGATTFGLVATDSSGSTSANVTFVVLTSSGPEVAQSALPQLAQIGPTSSPASLLLRPLQAFAFTFDGGTFTNTNADTKFYAVSANNTPLPDWVQFNSSSLEFSGMSPPLVSSTAKSQSFGIKLVASNVAGFSEAIIDFQLIVSYHILTSTDSYQAINISPGEDFSSIDFRKSLRLDSHIVADSDITSVTSNGPDWVHLNPKVISLSGTPPADAKSTNVTIVISDIYSDALNVIVDLVAIDGSISLFTGTLPNADATAGGIFSYTINSNLVRNNQVHLSAELGSASMWLHFSPQNRTLFGFVPRGMPTESQTITLVATEGNLFEARSFVIHIASALHISSSSITKTVSLVETSAPSARLASDSATSQPGPEALLMSGRNTIEVVLSTVLPGLFIVLVICLILCWHRKRIRQRRRCYSTSQEATVRSELRCTRTPEVEEVAPVHTRSERNLRCCSSSSPPRIELPWALDSMRISKNRISKRLRATPAASFDSTWDGFVVAETETALVRPPESIRTVHATEHISQDDLPSLREATPNYSRKKSTPSTQPLRQDSLAKRSFKRYSTVSMVSSALPQRLTGVGHGAGGASPPTFSEPRSSWQTTMGTIPGLESKRSTVNLNDFPIPPSETGGQDIGAVLQARSPNRPPQATLRLVQNNSTRSSGLQKWYTDRARDKLEGVARFSSASSRPSFSSRVLCQDSLGGRAISITLNSEIESSSGNTQQSLSGLARGRRTASIERFMGPSSYVRTQSKLRQDVSTASSGQFDSAISADSWEDENLIEDENADGLKQWQGSGGGGTPSPRLPFEAVAASPQAVASPVAPSRRLRLADTRNPVSVPDRQTTRSEKSEQGSLAFV